MNYTKRRRSDLKPLSESLGLSLSKGFLNFTAQKLRVFEIWARVVGPQDAANARPLCLQDGKLIVEVPGPAWLHHFSFKTDEWLRRLNNELDNQALVEKIILKVGEF